MYGSNGYRRLYQLIPIQNFQNNFNITTLIFYLTSILYHAILYIVRKQKQRSEFKMAKREFKMVEGKLIKDCSECFYCKEVSKDSKISYCREFRNVILDFFKFPEYCEFESIFKIIRKAG